MTQTPRSNRAALESIEMMNGGVLRECKSMEIELTAANDRIERLEEELMDAKNAHAALVADVVLYEDRAERIKLLEQACREMVSEEDTHIRLQTWLKAKQYIQLQTWLKAKAPQ